MQQMRGVFVTGTDTEVGKTVVSRLLVRAAIARGLRVAAMKPVASGAADTGGGLRNDDALALMAEMNVWAEYDEVNPYVFAEPVSPHIAAAAAGMVIEAEVVGRALSSLARRADVVMVEGVGGWRAPLGPRLTVAGLASHLGLPVVLVVGLRLGCLNHALLTAESIGRSGLPLAGWVGNVVDPGMSRLEENMQTLRVRLPAPCLGLLRHAADDPVGANEGRVALPESLV